MDPLTTATAANNKPTRTWAVSLTVLCVGIVAYGVIYSTNTVSNLTYLFGYNLPICLVIWAIFHVAVGRKQGTKKGGLSFLAIFAALIGGSLVGYSQQKSATTQAITEIQKSYTSIMSSANDAQGMPQRIEGNLDTTPKTKGYIGEIERFMKIFMNKMTSQRNDYLLELDAIGWEKILDPRRVSQDKTLIESKMMIQKAKDIVHKYRTHTYTLLANARNDINSLNISESNKSDMLLGFDKGMTNARAQIDAMWDLEGKTISEFDNIFALLSARKGAWAVQDGQILFANQSDLDAFNSYVTAIQKIAAKQQDIQKRSTEIVNNKFNSLK